MGRALGSQEIIAFDYLPEDFGQFLVDLDNEELVKAVEQILAKPGPTRLLATFLAPFLRLGRPLIVNRCLDELVGLGPARCASQQNLTEPDRERLYELERGLVSTPLWTLVEVFAGRRDTLTDAASVRRAIDVLASSASIDPDGVPPASFASGLTLQTLARQLGVIVLSAEDPEGREKAAFACLIGSTGYGELRDLLQELVAAESVRVRQFFSKEALNK